MTALAVLAALCCCAFFSLVAWGAEYRLFDDRPGLSVALMLVPLIGFFAALAWMERRWRIDCPHCCARLLPERLHATATGRCPKCETALWEQPETGETEMGESETGESGSSMSGSDDKRLWRRAELAEILHRVRPDRRIVLRFLVATIVAGVTTWLLGPHLAELWERHWGVTSLPLLQPLLIAPAIVVAGWGVLAVLRGMERDSAVCACPACGATLRNRFPLTATGRCPQCGSRTVLDPLPAIPALRSGRPIPIDDVRQSVRFYSRWGILSCFVGGAFGAAWFAAVFPLVDSPAGEPLTSWEIVLLCVAFPWQIGGVLLTDGLLRSRLRCPDCRSALAALGAVVLSTGNCPHCGHAIVVRGTPAGMTE